jgi:hypothetical protein
MKKLAAALFFALVVGCSEDRSLEAARADARAAIVAAQCDYDATIHDRPNVHAACNEVRTVCADGPTPELRATPQGCRAAVSRLVSATEIRR